jgi:uncharacterized protein (DUF2252 family)
VFGVTDFDESYWGPWTWDIRRMAVSIILAAKENGLSSTDQGTLVNDFLDAYFNKINDFKGTNDELSYQLTSSNTSSTSDDVILTMKQETASTVPIANPGAMPATVVWQQ